MTNEQFSDLCKAAGAFSTALHRVGLSSGEVGLSEPEFKRVAERLANEYRTPRDVTNVSELHLYGLRFFRNTTPLDKPDKDC